MRKAIVAGLLFCLFVRTATATLVLTQWTPERILVAADSLSIKVNGQQINDVVECKIHQTGDVFFTIIGINSDPTVKVDLVALADRAVRSTSGIIAAADWFDDFAKGPIRKLVGGEAFRSGLAGNTLDIVFASRREPILVVREYNLHSDGGLSEEPVDIRSRMAPSKSKTKVTALGVYAEAEAALSRTVRMQNSDTIDLSVWFIRTQRDFELERRQAKQIPRVGLPISILQIQSGRASWVPNYQGACPSIKQ